ncbi:MAG: lysophospholipid acyltransferase family protein [Nitrospirae bacterium]|nr:lysophospholipid acyltransferase family protein [Nitrospirota bacterium]
MRAVKHTIIWFVWVVLRPILRFIPLKIMYRAASISATVAYLCATKKRKTLISELKKIFKDGSKKQLQSMAHKSFIIYYKRQVENVIFGDFTKERLERVVSIEGLEYLNQAVKEGKGAIILLSHFGSHLLVPLALAYRGYLVNQLTGGPGVVKQLDSPVYERVVEIRRKDSSSLPITFLSAHQSLHAALKALKRNELVAIAMDGRVGKKWIKVNMFNMETTLSPGPVRIALKTGAPIIPTFIIRNRDNTHKLILESPIELDYFKDEEKTIAVNTQKLARSFESYILRFPCHFGMILQIMRERVQNGILESSILP